MHFILEEQLEELVGNIKLSSVTAENNWVFCPVACDFVWCLRLLGSSLTGGWGRCGAWEGRLEGCLRLENGCGSPPVVMGGGPWRPRWESWNRNCPAKSGASLLPPVSRMGKPTPGETS